jgi:hypothetical protein
MAQLIPHCLKYLLGKEVVSLGRLAFSDEDSLFNETLILELQDQASIEILKTNQNDLDIHNILSDEKFIIPSWVEDEDEDVEDISVKKFKYDKSNMPFVIDSITEFWIGQKGEEFLAGITFHNQSKEALLCLCTETDEIEILSHSELYNRIMSLPFYFGSVLILWYD